MTKEKSNKKFVPRLTMSTPYVCKNIYQVRGVLLLHTDTGMK